MTDFCREDYILNSINFINQWFFIGEAKDRYTLIRETDEIVELVYNHNKELIVLNKNYILQCHYVRKKQD